MHYRTEKARKQEQTFSQPREGEAARPGANQPEVLGIYFAREGRDPISGSQWNKNKTLPAIGPERAPQILVLL